MKKDSKILIVDDDFRNIFALSAVLKSKGYVSQSADSALSGIQMLRASKDFGVVLLDMMMPEMDGYEAISIIRKTKEIASIPIIAVTAQAMPGDKEKCLAAGADAYLSKPVDLDQLLHILKNYQISSE